MGRRTDELTAIRAARAHVRSLVGRFDIAEFLAQTEAAKCIETLAGFRDDMTLSTEFRRQCALDLLDRGYGKPTTKTQFTIAAPMQAEPEDVYAEQVAGAITMADQFREMTRYVGRVPIDQWPAHVREMAGKVIEGAAETSGDDAPKAE